jgi:hypothetical protein
MTRHPAEPTVASSAQDERFSLLKRRPRLEIFTKFADVKSSRMS